jgi:serine/threonine protein kinase
MPAEGAFESLCGSRLAPLQLVVQGQQLAGVVHARAGQLERHTTAAAPPPAAWHDDHHPSPLTPLTPHTPLTPQTQQVESEIRILQQLSHEGLISYEFIADEGNKISIVMAWAGTPLRDHRVARPEVYNEDAARHMATQLTSALAFLHARGILHRDIKPDNLGVLHDERLQLFDWGEAVTLAEVGRMPDRELSKHVGVAGTPLFMPPESLNHVTRRPSEDGSDDDSADGVPGLRSTLHPALDVWGLGTVVYFLLAGRDIFIADSAWELEELADVVNCSSGVALPEGVEASFAARDFLRRCLERCPARRAGAKELLVHPWLRGAATAEEVEAARAADAAAAAAAMRRSASAASLGGRRPSSGRLSRAASTASNLGDAVAAALARPGSGGPMRRTGSGRLHSQSSSSLAAAAAAAAAGAPPGEISSHKIAGSLAGDSPPRPGLREVDGAAVCEITVRMRPSASCSALEAN